ncbi:hypothetical protein ADL00_08330 [Streptomyces sp. AS58]|uniref:hypothetical protein n=1 Tax=Streptomyces sp. AS58 TaxID=1519489 RepID=UPI0006AFFC6D|nr:hypothetical protein [Streptomyces sp. AS58]KOV71345.1 hypothetical protein ADL00_08330 [Streptomyces sp. AS58]
MKFLAITLIVHRPDPITGVQKPTHDRFREVLDNALLAEELGFDGFGVGEREALALYRPIFESTLAFLKQFGLPVVFESVEDFVERSSALIGSPQQIVDKVHRYHEQFGHTVLRVHADASGLTRAQHRASLELFQSEAAPELRRQIPDPPFTWGPVLPVTEEEPAHV